MKIFQILNNFCHYDATAIHPTIDDTVGKYAANIVFVEAPDYVFEGWGYDDTKEGEARFIKPTPPDGWYYDDEAGCFVEIKPPKSITNQNTEDPAFNDIMTAYEEGVNEA